jgi:sugar O-acyltransferase (sialic acid O-acetyltransferase NeuD family)
MLPIYAVYGASGFGREVMPVLREMLNDSNTPYEKLVFIDDGVDEDELNGYQVFSYDEFLSLQCSSKCVVLAIANSQIREKLTTRCLLDKVQLISVEANNVVTMDKVSIGGGSILSPFVTLTSNIRIGKQFHANIYSYVAHDCIIGDYVTFAPSVKCNGNVQIGDHAYIGTGAIIKQGLPGKPLKIGTGAIIGMGAVVTKDVAPHSTVVGNPALPLNK